MKRTTPIYRFIGLACLAVIVAAGCSSSSHSASTTSAAPGVLTIGADEWPKCVNPLTDCANSTWQNWLVPTEVLPRLTELDAHGNYVASPLITGLPSIANGGITQNPFTVTYHLNPAARWEPDGTRITAADVEFTLNALGATPGPHSTSGIARVETPNADTVSIVYKHSYADWPDTLGGLGGSVLEKSKFASPDVANTMQDSIGFSGGPWILKSFTAQREVLVANTHYWDAARIPHIHEVDFVPDGSPAHAAQMLRSGTVSVLYPQPDADALRVLQSTPDVRRTFGTTTQFESLWFNEKPGRPFADVNVRAAFSYAFDRQLFLDTIVKPFDPDVQPLDCADWIPGHGPWCDNRTFADVKPDPTKVAAAMTASGYAKDAKGIWAKGGQELVIHWMVNTDSTRRLATQTLFIPLLAQQGFLVVADNSDAATMFQQRIPAGDYDFAMFIEVSSPDPSVADILNSTAIPSAANNFGGGNVFWYSDANFDAISNAADGELDVARRATDVHELDAILRQDYATLPLYAFPTLVAWRSDRVSGPVDQYIDSPQSVFANLWAWTTPAQH